MPTALITHTDCILHSNGPGHPESPERLSVILEELNKPDYANLKRIEAPLATIDQIAQVHDRKHIEFILNATPKNGHVLIEAAEDPDMANEDTMLSIGSDKAALRAAGALIKAVDLVMANQAANAFCAIRPPGHHAGYTSSEGFCLFNNIAIGTEHAIQKHGIKRIAILDIDVHHGNGTQEWAEKNPNILFCSLHQWPLYPGSGRAEDCGPHKNIINVPLPSGTIGQAYREALLTKVFPAIDAFAPELIMISAGFDTHRDDPLASLELTEDDYHWITAEVCRLANKHCQGRLISTLEGGYDLTALAKSVGAHVKALMKAEE